MSIEFFLGLAVVVFGMAALAWVYSAIFDFVDWWKKKARLREIRSYTFMRNTFDDQGRPVLVPDPEAEKAALEQGRLPPMAPAGRYGVDHEPPAGPPDGWEKRPSRPMAARMLD